MITTNFIIYFLCPIQNEDILNNAAPRRTHYKATAETLTVDSTTKEVLHVRHRAHASEGKLFYKGKLVAEKSQLNSTPI